MAFRVADTAIGPALLNSNGDCFNLVGVLRHDNWQGRNSVQFIIEDVMRGRMKNNKNIAKRAKNIKRIRLERERAILCA